MRARKKGSNYEWDKIKYVQLEGSDILFKEEYLEFEQDPSSPELETYDQVYDEKHWQDVRERAAIAAMQAILSNPSCEINSNSIDVIPKNAMIFADALVEQLKKKV